VEWIAARVQEDQLRRSANQLARIGLVIDLDLDRREGLQVSSEFGLTPSSEQALAGVRPDRPDQSNPFAS
jgi:hypothetical protein